MAAKNSWWQELGKDLFQTPAIRDFVGRQVSTVKDWTQKQITSVEGAAQRVTGPAPSAPAAPPSVPWLLIGGSALVFVLLIARRR